MLFLGFSAGNVLHIAVSVEAIRAGDEYGSSYPLDSSAVRGVVWLATGMFRSCTPSASVPHFYRYLPMEGIIPLPS